MNTYSAASRLLITSAAALVVAGCGSSGSGDKVESRQLPVVHELRSQKVSAQTDKRLRSDSKRSPKRAVKVPVELPDPVALPQVPVAINNPPAVLPMRPSGVVRTGSDRKTKSSRPTDGPVTKPIAQPVFKPEDELPPAVTPQDPPPSAPAPVVQPAAPVEISGTQQPVPVEGGVATEETVAPATTQIQPQEAVRQDPPAEPDPVVSDPPQAPVAETPPPTPPAQDPVPEPAPEPAPEPQVVEPEVPEVEAPPSETEIDDSPVTGELQTV